MPHIVNAIYTTVKNNRSVKNFIVAFLKLQLSLKLSNKNYQIISFNHRRAGGLYGSLGNCVGVYWSIKVGVNKGSFFL